MSETPNETAHPTAVVARSTLRRAPRFGRFILAGLLLGAVLSALAAVLGPPHDFLGRGTVFLLVFLALGGAGMLVAALLAVLADLRSGRARPHHRE